MDEERAPEFSLVLVCHNKADLLAWICEQYLAAAPPDLYWELLLVDNASSDETSHELARLAGRQDLAEIRALKLESHQGYGYALHAGLRAAKGWCLGWSLANRGCDPSEAFGAFEMLRRTRKAEKMLVTGQVPRSKEEVWTDRIARAVLWRRLQNVAAPPKVFTRDLMEFLGEPPAGREFDLYVAYRAAQKEFDRLEMPVAMAPGVFRRRRGMGWIKYLFQLRFSTEP